MYTGARNSSHIRTIFRSGGGGCCSCWPVAAATTAAATAAAEERAARIPLDWRDGARPPSGGRPGGRGKSPGKPPSAPGQDGRGLGAGRRRWAPRSAIGRRRGRLANGMRAGGLKLAHGCAAESSTLPYIPASAHPYDHYSFSTLVVALARRPRRARAARARAHLPTVGQVCRGKTVTWPAVAVRGACAPVAYARTSREKRSCGKPGGGSLCRRHRYIYSVLPSFLPLHPPPKHCRPSKYRAVAVFVSPGRVSVPSVFRTSRKSNRSDVVSETHPVSRTFKRDNRFVLRRPVKQFPRFGFSQANVRREGFSSNVPFAPLWNGLIRAKGFNLMGGGGAERRGMPRRTPVYTGHRNHGTAEYNSLFFSCWRVHIGI